MSSHDARVLALAEARGLLQQLTDSNRRDRAAFTLGYILAFDAMGNHLPPADRARHLLRARALQVLSNKEFR